MKAILTSATAVFACLPGLAIMWKGLGTPAGYDWLFGGVIEAIGVFSILTIWVNRDAIKRAHPKKISNQAIYLSFWFVVLLIVYIFLINYCIITHPTHESVYFPFWLEGRAEELVIRAGGRWAALDRYGHFPLASAISRMPSYIINTTTIILLLIYQGIFTCLTVAFGLVAVKAEKKTS